MGTVRNGSLLFQANGRALQKLESSDTSDNSKSDTGDIKNTTTDTSSIADMTLAAETAGNITGDAAASALEVTIADASFNMTAPSPELATSEVTADPNLRLVTTLFDGMTYQLSNYSLVCQLLISESDGLNNALV